MIQEAQLNTASTSTSSPHAPIPSANLFSSFSADSPHHLWAVVDPEIARENPVEDKHRRLVRSHRSSPYDRELKPNAKIRDDLGVRPRICKGIYAPNKTYTCSKF
jgi:phosphatidylinositol 3-kinase